MAEYAALVWGLDDGLLLDSDGVITDINRADLPKIIAQHDPILCHARALGRRLDIDISPGWDILSLYAFIYPARPCVPTPAGVAYALGLTQEHYPDLVDQAMLLLQSASHLLDALEQIDGQQRPILAAIARSMGRAGWPWATEVLARLDDTMEPSPASDRVLLGVWDKLPEWEEQPPAPPPRHIPVAPAEARQKLGQLLVHRPGREDRPQQGDYASALCHAFQPRTTPDQPVTILAEAGTGIGKTLGYLAPALLWAERNEAPVWISTYTRHLQNQIDSELSAAFENDAEKKRRVVIRKGRENYLCLLNLEEATNLLATAPQYGIAVGLMLRWIMATRQGDLHGGDLPGWLPDLVGRGRSLGLADRRGECIYAACPHYQRCFIERNVHAARDARIVIGNHALVMVQSALRGAIGLGGTEADSRDQNQLLRLIFDEGHHLFDAADSAFSCHLTGAEGYELRRWLLGMEGGRRSRMRGLRRRLEDRLAQDPALQQYVEDAMRAARCLPGENWYERISNLEPDGPIETFLTDLRSQIINRNQSDASSTHYGYECDPLPAEPAVLASAVSARNALADLSKPLKNTARHLRQLLADETQELNTDQRKRLDAIAASIECRVAQMIDPWQGMLGDLLDKALEDPTGASSAQIEQQGQRDQIDWFVIGRGDNGDVDIGYHRHWIDATRPVAATLGRHVHGMVVTSATLTDGTGHDDHDWQIAEQRSGTRHWITPPQRARLVSPFDYPAQTQVLIIQDVRKDDLDQVAAAFRGLFMAAGGGGLGIFTAIQRLKAVHQRIAPDLAAAHIPLYAQHIDGMDVASLVDIFRFETDSCLLGTDAVRDGVDVPGHALRLLVFDRVPWPRPDIIHRARRHAFGGRGYDDMLTRLRLKQAFGRLIRRADDRGVFVLLDPMMPSRLYGAFPSGVIPVKTGLLDAMDRIKNFLSDSDLDIKSTLNKKSS